MRGIPVLVALNKSDLRRASADQLTLLAQQGLPFLEVSATVGENVAAMRTKLMELAPAEASESPVVLRDLVGPGEMAVLVMPIDKEAPKGRIKQLQVQSIRDLLDNHASCVVVQDTGLESVLDNLKTPPKLVVTDAQVFDRVARVTPDPCR